MQEMIGSEQDPAQLVSMTEAAARRVAAIIADEGDPNLKLRVTVSGGGCSGFQYGFSLDAEQAGDDLAVIRDGVTLLVDQISLMYLAGSEIDYVDELIGAAFQIRNPNATAQCGCGTSFSV